MRRRAYEHSWRNAVPSGHENDATQKVRTFDVWNLVGRGCVRGVRLLCLRRLLAIERWRLSLAARMVVGSDVGDLDLIHCYDVFGNALLARVDRVCVADAEFNARSRHGCMEDRPHWDCRAGKGIVDDTVGTGCNRESGDVAGNHAQRPP